MFPGRPQLCQAALQHQQSTSQAAAHPLEVLENSSALLLHLLAEPGYAMRQAPSALVRPAGEIRSPEARTRRRHRESATDEWGGSSDHYNSYRKVELNDLVFRTCTS